MAWQKYIPTADEHDGKNTKPIERRAAQTALDACRLLVKTLSEPGVSINNDHEAFHLAKDALILAQGSEPPYRGPTGEAGK